VPSTRALAAELAVSRQPVLTAYDQLLHEGYLDGRTGSGTFASAALPDDLLRSPASPAAGSPRIAPRRVPPPPPDAREEGGLEPFRMSLPALDRFPQKERTWRRRSTTDRNRESTRQSTLAMCWKGRRSPGEGRGGFRYP
jgi:GntR family transcriptional regulator/MocR family aminotransferase